MLEVTLGEKKYTVPYVSALALREIARPMEIIRRTEEEEASPRQYERDLDTLVSWFCVLFGNQFSPGRSMSNTRRTGFCTISPWRPWP